MNGIDHRDELVACVRGGVACSRRKESDRVVAPEIAQLTFGKKLFVDKLENGHQFDGRDAQRTQVLENLCIRKAGEPAAVLLWQIREAHRVAANVGLVQHGVFPGSRRLLGRRSRHAPGDHGLRHKGCAVRCVRNYFSVGNPMIEHGRCPAERAVQRARVRVHEQLRRICPQASVRIEGPVNSKAVALADAALRNEPVPDAAIVRR